MADEPHGWYCPPNSRRFHYIGTNGKSLCGKWMVFAWSGELVGRDYGLANGDCAACKRKLETGGEYVTEEVAAVIDALGAPE